jgi:hypothetical protein
MNHLAYERTPLSLSEAIYGLENLNWTIGNNHHYCGNMVYKKDVYGIINSFTLDPDGLSGAEEEVLLPVRRDGWFRIRRYSNIPKDKIEREYISISEALKLIAEGKEVFLDSHLKITSENSDSISIKTVAKHMPKSEYLPFIESKVSVKEYYDFK